MSVQPPHLEPLASLANDPVHDQFILDTMFTDKKRVRRNHSPALKAQILAECAQPGASVAQVARAHGINASIVHGWRKLARQLGPAILATPAFVPLQLAPPALAHTACAPIDIELRRGPLSVRVQWPAGFAAELAHWMREVLNSVPSR